MSRLGEGSGESEISSNEEEGGSLWRINNGKMRRKKRRKANEMWGEQFRHGKRRGE